MEVGRRSVGSNDDLRESGRKKKPWALPLATLLSFNDRGVHPECPNASNSFHKCGRHCVDKIPSRKILIEALASEEDWGKKSEKRGVNPNCPNASNPFHKCAEYCFEKLPEKRQDAGKIQTVMKPKGEKKAGFITDRLVKPECKNASNPYHVCDEYCLDNVTMRDEPPGQVMRLKSSRELEKVLRNKERTGLPPLCKHTSNPYHKCTAICSQRVPGNNLAEGDDLKGVSTKTDISIVRHSLEHASGPFHKVKEDCFEDTSELDHHKGDPKGESEIAGTVKPNVNHEGKNASTPDNLCAENCIQSVSEDESLGQENLGGVSIATDKANVHHNHEQLSSHHHKITEHCFEDSFEKEEIEGVVKPKEVSEIVVIEEEHVVTFECKNASKPFHLCTEYGPQSLPMCDHPEQDLKPKDDITGFTAPLGVNCKFKNASNPNHVCTEDCFQNLPVKGQHGVASKKLKKDYKVVAPLESGMNSPCKNASNPYHVCAEYCLQGVPKGHHLGRALTKSKEEKKAISSSQKVNSECTNASNPYHKCAEYCFENVLERDQPRKTIMKSKEKEGVVLPPEVEVNPDCKFASNPYHSCAEYCSQNVPEKEQHRQVMKLKSLKELKKLVSTAVLHQTHTKHLKKFFGLVGLMS